MWVRDTQTYEKRKLRITGFKPYFYVPETDVVPAEPWVDKVEFGFMHMNGKPDKKIVVTEPLKVSENRDRFTEAHEADIEYVQRLLIDTDILSCFYTPITLDVVPYWAMSPVEKILKPLIVYMDIEVQVKGRFPNVRSPTRPVVAVTFYDNYYKKYVTICVDDRVWKRETIELASDWTIIKVPTHLELISCILEYLHYIKPDIVTGWNISFDIDYLQAWAKVNFRKDIFKDESIEIFDLLEAYKKSKSSIGNRLKEVVVKEGVIKAEDMVSETFKVEMYNDPSQRDTFFLYNKKDTEYCVQLNSGFKRVTDGKFIQYNLIENFWNQRNFVGLHTINYTTQHVKRHDPLWLRVARNLGFTLPSGRHTDRNENDDDDLEFGGVVFTPPPGIYRDLTVLDMSRYYPSILLSFPKETSPDIWGLLAPTVIKYLSSERTFWDNELKKHVPGTEDYNTVKVSLTIAKTFLSGAWGYFAFKGCRIFSKERGDFVLKTAGDGLNRIKKRAKEVGHETVYGDSVRFNTPTLIKRNNVLMVLNIEKVKIGDYIPYEDGWTKVLNVIPKNVSKRMYRVETYDGVVEVTEDHSLVDEYYNERKPTTLNVGDNLGNVKYVFPNDKQWIDNDLAWLLGYFCADGTAGDYRDSCNKTCVHLDGQKIELLQKSQKIILSRLGFECNIDTYKSNMSKGGMVYRLNIHDPIKSGALKYFLENCYDEKHEKIVPTVILNSHRENIENFVDGFFCGDGSIKNKEKTIEYTKTPQIMFGIHILYKILNIKSRYMVYVGQKKRRQYLRKIRIINNIYDKRINYDHKVKKITDLGVQTDLVYDLETESHHFSSGGVLLHNTDSIFLDSDMEAVEKLVLEVNKELTRWAEELHIKDSRFQIKEDRFAKTTLFIEKKGSTEGAKKRYGQLIVREGGEACYYVLVKGFDYVRGNTSEVTRKLQKEVIDDVLMDKRDKIIVKIKTIVDRMKSHGYELDQITIPVNLSMPFGPSITTGGEYYDGANWNNKYLKESIIAGDMVRYFQAKNCGRFPYNKWVSYLDAKVISDNKIVPDYGWIIERTLKSPLENILSSADISWDNVLGFQDAKDFFGG